MTTTSCKNCGQSLNQGVSACDKCGTPAQSQPGSNNAAMPPNQDHPGMPGQNNNITAHSSPGTNVKKPKSKLVAGLLAILLGYGIYNFYLKKTAKAVIQLVGTLVAGGFLWYDVTTYLISLSQWTSGPQPPFMTPAFSIGMVIATGIGIWQLVEGILILCGKINRDGNGNPIE